MDVGKEIKDIKKEIFEKKLGYQIQTFMKK